MKLYYIHQDGSVVKFTTLYIAWRRDMKEMRSLDLISVSVTEVRCLSIQFQN